jgi:hypothetical protein|tara:strand:+ start:8977 stop:10224 length:1248 start_codon:yes stop_codon:yes gene_type:complete
MKFFLFRQKPVSISSERYSNTGISLAVFGVPAESLSHISAELGIVNFVFKDAGLYEITSPENHEALEKTRVSVSCAVGEEFEFIQDVMNFVAVDSNKKVMIFDTVRKYSTFPQAKVSDRTEIKTILPKQPIVLSTGDTSPIIVPFQTPISDIAGLTFTSNDIFPVVDYNETTLSALAIDDEVSAWKNSGSGGSRYNITSNTGAPVYSRSGTNYLATNAINVAAADLLHLAEDLIVEGDYTMYFAYSIPALSEMHQIYSDSSANTQGIGQGTIENKVFFTFDGNSGRPAEARTDTTDYGTVAYKIQDPKIENVTTASLAPSAGAQLCYVFVIRRDKDYNIHVHNHTGETIAYIPAVVGGEATRDFRTDGNLNFNRVGGTLWKGHLSRFGVIGSDIGSSDGSSLAKQLFERYNFYSF